jgi:hypothetical protein
MTHLFLNTLAKIACNPVANMKFTFPGISFCRAADNWGCRKK